MQTTGDLVATIAELAAGVQHRQRHGECRDLLLGVFFHRNAATVIDHSDSVTIEQLHQDRIAVAS